MWSTALEKFGSPMLIGHYRRGAPPEEVEALLATMAQAATASSMALPEGQDVQLLAAVKSGGSGGAGGGGSWEEPPAGTSPTGMRFAAPEARDTPADSVTRLARHLVQDGAASEAAAATLLSVDEALAEATSLEDLRDRLDRLADWGKPTKTG